MGLSRTAKYYRDNPEARRKRKSEGCCENFIEKHFVKKEY